jgi:hypothetical protein
MDESYQTGYIWQYENPRATMTPSLHMQNIFSTFKHPKRNSGRYGMVGIFGMRSRAPSHSLASDVHPGQLVEWSKEHFEKVSNVFNHFNRYGGMLWGHGFRGNVDRRLDE